MKLLNRNSLPKILSFCVITLFATTQLTGCSGEAAKKAEASDETKAAAPVGISPQKFADAVHAVMMADRTIYAKKVVNRLKEAKSEVSPHEYWEDNPNTIPLPAQMFRMGAELVDKNEKAGFKYGLKSKWPLNKQNIASTEIEIKGLEYIAEKSGENFYGEEELGGKKYFTAIYPDRAVAKACWSCHNDHENRGEDYPEFKDGDVMGGVVVRIPLD